VEIQASELQKLGGSGSNGASKLQELTARKAHDVPAMRTTRALLSHMPALLICPDSTQSGPEQVTQGTASMIAALGDASKQTLHVEALGDRGEMV
jgi:hypothetical protein